MRSRRLLRLGPLGWLVALLPIVAARAEFSQDVPTTAGSGISIQVETPLKFAPHFGFLPLRVTIQNQSAQGGVWHVAVTSGDASAFPGLALYTFDVSAAAGATRQQWVFAPLASPGVVATPVFDPNAPPAAVPLFRAGTSAGSSSTIPPAASKATEEAATAVLAPTHLLDIPWGVTETITTANGVVTFEQTGGAWALGKPPESSLPAGVFVNIHPALQAGQVIRTITYVDPEDLAALQEPPESRVDAYHKAVNRNTLALWRYGYLRKNAAVETTLPSSFADRDGVVTTTVTETGPASLLSQPLPEALPPDTLVTVVPAEVPPGGVIRKFTVTTLVPAVADDPTTAQPFSAVLGAAEPGLIRVQISGPGIEKPLWTDLSSGLDGQTEPMPPIAVPPALDDALRERLALGNLRAPPTVTAVNIADLPADWRVWSTMHAVFLSASEYAQLDPERKTALLRWVALGGRIVLSSPSDAAAISERIGAGVITTLRGDLAYIPPSEASRQLQLASPALSLPVRESLSRDSSAVEPFGSGERSDTHWLIYALVGFAVIAGPVNLLIFAPSGRRHRIIVTMPLIAVLGAVVMGAGIVVRAGLGGEGIRSTVIALVPDEGGAAVFQDQVSRTGVLISKRFTLPDDTVMAAAPLDAGGGSLLATDLIRVGGVAQGDWFRSRDYQAYHLRRFEELTGTINVTNPGQGGAPTVTSSLPSALTDFAWIDGQDRIWTAPAVEPGQSVTLTLATEKDWPRMHPQGSKELDAIFAAVSTREPGRWVARGGGSGLVPIPTLASIRWNESQVLVAGVSPVAGGSQNSTEGNE